MPVRSAITDASPIWSVAPCRSWVGGSCHTVCPCEPISATSAGLRFAAAITASAALANASPMSTFSRHKRSTELVSGRNAAKILSRNSAGCGTVMCLMSFHSKLGGSPRRSTTAASIPSADVPEMSPITIMISPTRSCHPERSEGSRTCSLRDPSLRSE